MRKIIYDKDQENVIELGIFLSNNTFKGISN